MLYICICILFMSIASGGLNASASLRIHEGRDADIGDYPYVVRIEYQLLLKNNKSNNVNFMHLHLCSASAVGVTWILTAAHCLTNSKFTDGKLLIRYGHVLSTPWTKDSFSDLLLIIIHPLYTHTYSGMYNAVMRNDIGLAKTTPMNIKTYIKLSAVDYLTLYGHEAILAGFGRTSRYFANVTGVADDTLNLRLPLQILDVLIIKCKTSVLQPGLCLAPRCGSSGIACAGDSGGPLMHPSGQIGILSLSEDVAHCLVPIKSVGVYIAGVVSPITPYIEWINSYVSS